jgi:CRISPR-associated endonuclease/helicase Cas3
MSETKSKRSYNFGRLFFPDFPRRAIPTEVRLQRLGNHVGNVVKLVRLWNWESERFEYDRESAIKRVKTSAEIHDLGKPQKFSIQSNTDKFKEYIYSFRGHRFLADSKDLWAKTLAIGHHDFSVHDICRDAYTLKKDPQYAEILAREPLAYAIELYILEMCDQIEAELACRVLDDAHQGESRTFMDYTITKSETEQDVYYIDSWAFAPELEQDGIELTFQYWSMQPSEEHKKLLQECIDKQKENKLGETLDRCVKAWWHSEEGESAKILKRNITLKPYPSTKTSNRNPWTAQSFYDQVSGFSPNLMQEQMFDAIYGDQHPAILLKAPTGSGKTETVLFPALASGYRLFLPLPTRSLLEDQKERIEKYLKTFSALAINTGKEFSLVVDTGSQMYRYIYQNGEEVKRNINARRHLYKGDVVLTTLDKFLYRYFAFGDKQKSFVFPLRIHQDKTLICFDESHSYDEVAFTNFSSLVKSLYEAGRSLVLMTATMPEELSKQLDYLETFDYINHPELNKYHRERDFEWFSNVSRDKENPELFQQEFTQVILNEWNTKPNRRILAVVETVKDAVAIYQQLKESFKVDATNERFLFLYHGRIADQLRPDLYKLIKQRDDLGQPCILVTTSAIEVGCDLNSEVLISEICPPENLIQRAGRCNRNGKVTDAKVIVVGDKIQDFANSLDDDGWANYAETLVNLTNFDSKQISECISRSEHIDDYRVVELFSMLHEYVYGADLTCQPIHEKGLVITRSWTPSATLIYENGDKSPPKITVPLDRLTEKEDNQYSNTHVYEHHYNSESTRWSLRPLTYGYAYSKDIVIKIFPENDGAFMPDGKEEYKYDSEIGFINLPGVFIKPKSSEKDGFTQRLLYYHDKSTTKKPAVIFYTKALNKEDKQL